MIEQGIKILSGIGLIATGLIITPYRSYKNKNEIDKHKELTEYDPYKRYRDIGDLIHGLPVFIGISLLLIGATLIVSAFI